jgi:hypothetical protein
MTGLLLTNFFFDLSQLLVNMFVDFCGNRYLFVEMFNFNLVYSSKSVTRT